ncbi:hypothetical protein CgunFtcFv8_021625 [Champsocephalus gunnari]|uniref:Secreted protein n=1 Tax=Champsocephalus gunnari TaxID=52237 RepID=A0AAN8DQC1_CHAGU|nr:hypothetical protein CgunFtcFv8_021625 [Champsocephalus gunnari]
MKTAGSASLCAPVWMIGFGLLTELVWGCSVVFSGGWEQCRSAGLLEAESRRRLVPVERPEGCACFCVSLFHGIK